MREHRRAAGVAAALLFSWLLVLAWGASTASVHPDDAAEPLTLLAAGMVHVDGRVELKSCFILEGSEPDEPVSGNFSVELRDQGGAQVAERALQVDFEVHVDPLGTFPTDTYPFIVELPYPPLAATLHVNQDDHTLFTADIDAVCEPAPPPSATP